MLNKSLKTISFIFLLSFLFGCTTTKAIYIPEKNYAQEYFELAQSKNIEKIQNLLTEWEEVNPTDPDIFTCKAQFYMAQAYKITFNKSKIKPDVNTPYTMEKGKDGSITYITKNPIINYDKFNSSLKAANDGISLYPNRIDYYIDKIILYQTVLMYEEAKDVMMDILKQSKKNKMIWYTNQNYLLLEPSRPKVENERGFIELLYESACREWFYIGTETSKKCVTTVYKELSNLFPNNEYIYLILGTDLLNVGQIEEGEANLLKANKMNPNNLDVVRNLAYLYTILSPNETKALPYINELLQSNDETYKSEGATFDSFFNSTF